MHPCFSDASDFRPMGKAEHARAMGMEVAVGYIVPRPFGPGTDRMLMFLVRDGVASIIECEIPTILHRPPEEPPMNMTLLQSNPRRYDMEDDEAHGV
jgi:hypothetical protein